MSRTNLAHLEPSARTVLSVADTANLPVKAEPAPGELDGDLDHLCRLLVRTERSLSLVNRRSFAAALADVPPVPNQALRPAPPFPEAVSVAREEGKLLERTRLFLAQNPRALDELTPELTFALLRHFDPTVRLRPAPFVRHLVAVVGVTIIALTAVALGIIHTQQNEAITAYLNPPAPAVQPMPVKVSVAREPAPLPRRAYHPVRPRYENEVAVIPRVAPSAVVPVVPAQPAAVAKPAPSVVSLPAVAAQAPPLPSVPRSAPSSIAVPPPPRADDSANTSQVSQEATAMILRTIVAENPDASVEWIRAGKASDQVITVTSRVRRGGTVTRETYRLWSSHGNLTVIHHDASPER